MNKLYVFIGRSGAGKGTQVALLEDKIKALEPTLPTLVVETGSKFRELMATENYTAHLIREISSKGKLPPPFVGVHMWSHCLIDGYTGTGTVFIDGTPRMSVEVPLLLSMIDFYQFDAHIVNLSVSDEWAHSHIKSRGRPDDMNDDEVWERIKWFHESVEPAITLLRESPLITMHDIFGEQSIESVHQDICHVLQIPQ